MCRVTDEAPRLTCDNALPVRNKRGVVNSRGKPKKLGKEPAPASSRFCPKRGRGGQKLGVIHSLRLAPVGVLSGRRQPKHRRAWLAPIYLYSEPQIFASFCTDSVANIFIFIIIPSINDINEKARPKYCHDVGRYVYGRAMYRWQVSMVPRC
jgi:hypothetical protein